MTGGNALPAIPTGNQLTRIITKTVSTESATASSPEALTATF